MWGMQKYTPKIELRPPKIHFGLLLAMRDETNVYRCKVLLDALLTG